MPKIGSRRFADTEAFACEERISGGWFRIVCAATGGPRKYVRPSRALQPRVSEPLTPSVFRQYELRVKQQPVQAQVVPNGSMCKP